MNSLQILLYYCYRRFLLQKPICRIPFAGITLCSHDDGALYAYPCCSSWLSDEGKKKIPIKVLEQIDGSLDLKIAIKNKKFGLMRESILKGNYRYCNLSKCSALFPLDFKLLISFLLQTPRTPLHVAFSGDPACNLSCPSCRNTPNLLSNPKTSKRLQSCLQAGITSLYLNGNGEFFFNAEIMHFFSQFRASDFPKLKRIALISNGLLFTEKNWLRLSSDTRERINAIRISIDGCTQKTYEDIRKNGDFALLLKNLSFIGSLRKNGNVKLLEFSFVVQTSNFHEIADFVDFAAHYSVDRILFEHIENLGHLTHESYTQKTKYREDHLSIVTTQQKALARSDHHAIELQGNFF